MEITRDTLISEIVENSTEAMPVFQEIGMHCLPWPAVKLSNKRVLHMVLI